MRVRASSLNYRDLMALKGSGRRSDQARRPVRFHPRWFGGPIRPEYLTDRLGANLGMLAEYAVLSQEALVRVPNHLSLEEAATLPCAAVTAWVALALRPVGGSLALRVSQPLRIYTVKLSDL